MGFKNSDSSSENQSLVLDSYMQKDSTVQAEPLKVQCVYLKMNFTCSTEVNFINSNQKKS